MKSDDVLVRYPAFAFAGRVGKDPVHANIIVAVSVALLFVIGAVRDNTILMSRPDTGLLQHPGIWCFLVGQIWLPIVTRRSVQQFLGLPRADIRAFSATFIDTHFAAHRDFLFAWLERKTNTSRIIYSLLLLIGACAWAWNTYSNQRPELVGFDFWDSSRHLWGYALTRFYKAYAWLALMPSLVHIQVGLIATTRRTLIDAAGSAQLVLEPFHPDKAGGTTIFIDSVLNPMIPTVFIASMISLSAVFVHQKYDVTTIAGLSLACITLLFIYFVPATALRKAIISEKRRQILSIAQFQQELYQTLRNDTARTQPSLREPIEMMLRLDSIVAKIGNLPEWPQLRGTLRLVALAWGSPFVAWLAKHLSSRVALLLA